MSFPPFISLCSTLCSSFSYYTDVVPTLVPSILLEATSVTFLKNPEESMQVPILSAFSTVKVFPTNPQSLKISFVWQEHMIQNEVSILRRVKHPNIVLLIEEMDMPTELYLVMELVKVSVLETSCILRIFIRSFNYIKKLVLKLTKNHGIME